MERTSEVRFVTLRSAEDLFPSLITNADFVHHNYSEDKSMNALQYEREFRHQLMSHYETTMKPKKKILRYLFFPNISTRNLVNFLLYMFILK